MFSAKCLSSVRKNKTVRNTGIITAIILTVLMICLTGISYTAQAEYKLAINEVCSNNNAVLIDGNNTYCDYIELYNQTETEISLDGWYLSDDEYDLQMCSLEGYNIPSKGYLLIYANGTPKTDNVASVSFGVNDEGDSVYLSNENGEIIDSVVVPALNADQAYLRNIDDFQWQVATCSPGKSNRFSSPIFPEKIAAPVFSVESGIYEDGFELGLTAKKDQVIYYTVDGSEPDMTSTKYIEPILIARENVAHDAMTVRAKAYDEAQGMQSATVTQTYFFEDSDSMLLTENYTVSLVINPEYLYDHETGIYVSGILYEQFLAAGGSDTEYNQVHQANWKQGWKREGFVQIFDEEQRLIMEQAVLISMHGNASILRENKSFNLFAVDSQGQNTVFPLNLFEDASYTSSFMLRNGGSEYDVTRIRDGFLQNLAKDRAVSVQDYRLCNLYLNGEYMGGYTIQEKYNEEFLNAHYGVDADNVAIIKNNELLEGPQQALDDYYAIREYVKTHDMSKAENYQWVADRMDMQSFIDFCCVEMYTGNTDCYPRNNNTFLWKSLEQGGGEYEDEKWRWMLQDLDECAGHSGMGTDYTSDTFRITIPPDAPLYEDPFFMGLMKNAEFRQKFADSFYEIGSKNYGGQVVEAALEEIETTWAQTSYATFDIDEAEFQSRLAVIQEYFDNRMYYMKSHLKNDFNIVL